MTNLLFVSYSSKNSSNRFKPCQRRLAVDIKLRQCRLAVDMRLRQFYLQP
ncbi:Uncharacterised protein [Streptococcus pneumoniae]|nr:Uncharacterised protein [Streptococcus pneumoniae]